MRSRFPLLWAQAGVAGLLALWGTLQLLEGSQRPAGRAEARRGRSLAERPLAAADGPRTFGRTAQAERSARPAAAAIPEQRGGSSGAALESLQAAPLGGPARTPTTAAQAPAQGVPDPGSALAQPPGAGAAPAASAAPLAGPSVARGSAAAEVLLRTAAALRAAGLQGAWPEAAPTPERAPGSAAFGRGTPARPEWAAWALQGLRLAALEPQREPAPQRAADAARKLEQPLHSAARGAEWPGRAAPAPESDAGRGAPPRSGAERLSHREDLARAGSERRLEGAGPIGSQAEPRTAPAPVPAAALGSGQELARAELPEGLPAGADAGAAPRSAGGTAEPGGARKAAGESAAGSLSASVQVSDPDSLAERARGAARAEEGQCAPAAEGPTGDGSVRFVLTVTDRRGTPLPGLDLEVLMGEGGRPLRLRADAEGRVALALDPGRYRLRRQGQSGEARARLTVREGLRSVELEL